MLCCVVSCYAICYVMLCNCYATAMLCLLWYAIAMLSMLCYTMLWITHKHILIISQLITVI